jgi:hypothetical protein
MKMKTDPIMLDTISTAPPAHAGVHNRSTSRATFQAAQGSTQATGEAAASREASPVHPARGADSRHGAMTIHGEAPAPHGLTQRESGLVLQGSMAPAPLSALGQRKIGEILVQVGAMNNAEVQLVLDAQRAQGNRRLFGDIAIALGHVRRDQVIWALSQQFGYSYSGSTTEAALPSRTGHGERSVQRRSRVLPQPAQ